MPSMLRVVYPTPGFFLTDARLTVALDGYPIHDGTFLRGFEAGGPIAAGAHLLATRIDIDLFARTREYRFEIPATDPDTAIWVATLAYSRFWGNFGRKLQLARAT